MHRVPGHGEVRVRGQAGEVPQHVGLRDADHGRMPAAEELHGMLEPKNAGKEIGGRIRREGASRFDSGSRQDAVGVPLRAEKEGQCSRGLAGRPVPRRPRSGRLHFLYGTAPWRGRRGGGTSARPPRRESSGSIPPCPPPRRRGIDQKI